MNLGDVMDELSTALGTIEGLRPFPYSVRSITPPAAVVGWPDPYTYDTTMRRGLDRTTFPIYVVVGNVDARTSRDAISRYADGSGEASVKAVLEAAEFTACDSVRVQSCEFGTITVAGVEFLCATFQVDVIGEGAGD